MASQQFCLKWNNHTNNMLSVFENLLTSETFVDVTLACDGLSLKAHRMVLSACSPFFQSLFVENPCKHPVVIMKDMNFKDLKAIIDFMYHGEVNVAQDQLSTLLKTAETLKVKGLAEVSGASDQSSSSAQDLPVPQQSSVPSMATATPQQQRRASSPPMTKKRARRRKRSGDYSDDESLPAKIKEPDSPEIEELSGDASVEGGNEPILKQGFSSSQGPISSVNKSFSSRRSRSSVQVEEPSGEDYEPSKLLEQTLTTAPSMAGASSDVTVPSSSGMEISQIDMGDTTSALVPMSDSSHLDDDGSQDIKPEILTFDDSQTSPTAGTSQAMVYMDQPGTSYQDNSLVQDGQPQEILNFDVEESLPVPQFNLSKVSFSSKDTKKKRRLLDDTNETFIQNYGKKYFCSLCNKYFCIKYEYEQHISSHNVTELVTPEEKLTAFQMQDFEQQFSAYNGEFFSTDDLPTSNVISSVNANEQPSSPKVLQPLSPIATTRTPTEITQEHIPNSTVNSLFPDPLASIFALVPTIQKLTIIPTTCVCSLLPVVNSPVFTSNAAVSTSTPVTCFTSTPVTHVISSAPYVTTPYSTTSSLITAPPVEATTNSSLCTFSAMSRAPIMSTGTLAPTSPALNELGHISGIKTEFPQEPEIITIED